MNSICLRIFKFILYNYGEENWKWPRKIEFARGTQNERIERKICRKKIKKCESERTYIWHKEKWCLESKICRAARIENGDSGKECWDVKWMERNWNENKNCKVRWEKAWDERRNGIKGADKRQTLAFSIRTSQNSCRKDGRMLRCIV